MYLSKWRTLYLLRSAVDFEDFEITTSDDKLVPVGPDQLLGMPPWFTLHLRRAADGGPDVDMTWHIRDGAPECTEVRIAAVEGGHEIRVSGLAGLRISDCLDFVIKSMLSQKRIKGGGIKAPAWFSFSAGSREAIEQTRAARASRKTKITDDLLREVADVYRLNVSDKPTAAVAEHFGREHRTAALYIKRARDRGFLGAAIKGKAGEQS
jgi:hypothetical protein